MHWKSLLKRVARNQREPAQAVDAGRFDYRTPGMEQIGKETGILLLLVDGVGLPRNTSLSATIYNNFPTLSYLFDACCTPVDPCLGVEGAPQSATGQATILSGVNMINRMGGHYQGFPDAQLRAELNRQNLFLDLQAANCACGFANAYTHVNDGWPSIKFWSVTTTVVTSALGWVRSLSHLQRGEAVYHDITRETMGADIRGEEIPTISESEAAGDLLSVLRELDFCLFEYFLTDIAAHKGDEERVHRVLASLDRFLAALLEGMDTENELLLLVSDHGNIEAPETRGHTENPVPFCAYGQGAEDMVADKTSLLDVVPAIKRLQGVGA